MCGIAGILSRSLREEQLLGVAQSMALSLRRRGPDGEGRWMDPEVGVALVHRRLSIFDLSEAASQPMLSRCGRYVLTFNGEIYNFLSLREELVAEGASFQSQGDTEVLLEALARWGVPSALSRLEGMFAFGLWDRQQRELTLVRDRFGKKPLYYGTVNGCFLFASELRAFELFSDHLEIDQDGLALMLRYKAVPAPRSIYKQVRKLLPGSYTVVSGADFALREPMKYWDLLSRHRGATRSFGVDEALLRLEELLGDATRKRMASDVPLGAFLSGGIDSSLVVAMMAKYASQPVKTYTIGFVERSYDEAEQARAVSRVLGTDHTELYLAESDVLSEIPSLSEVSDEPFGDSSLLPTQLVSKLARTEVTVALSGDGGDEFFAGYNRHVWLPKLEQNFSKVPGVLMEYLARLLSWPRLRLLLNGLAERGMIPVRMLDNKLDKLQSLMGARGLESLQRDALSDWKQPNFLVQGCTLDSVNEFEGVPEGLAAVERLCRSDALFYLPEDILFKVDRSSMYHSLEARSPFLDHKLVEFSLDLPLSLKLDEGGGKSILRRLLKQYLPSELVERPKMGFAVPLQSWLRGPLRDWSEDLLRSEALASGEFMRPDVVLAVWDEHLAGRRDHSGKLWNVLMFLAWHQSLARRRQVARLEVGF